MLLLSVRERLDLCNNVFKQTTDVKSLFFAYNDVFFFFFFFGDGLSEGGGRGGGGGAGG